MAVSIQTARQYFANSVQSWNEAHLFKAKSLTSIMNKLYDCKYRVGFTGTLDGTETNACTRRSLW